MILDRYPEVNVMRKVVSAARGSSPGLTKHSNSWYVTSEYDDESCPLISSNITAVLPASQSEWQFKCRHRLTGIPPTQLKPLRPSRHSVGVNHRVQSQAF